MIILDWLFNLETPEQQNGGFDMNAMLQDKVAIVSGAGSGLGRGIALAFGREGARLVLADMSVEGGERTAAELKAAGAEAVFVEGDVADPAYHGELVARAGSEFGRLDIAVNNAGISHPVAPLAEIPRETWDKVIAVNLSGMFHALQAQIPALLENGSGAIVNMASLGGVVGARGLSPYAAAKHGVVGLTQNVALEYATQGIRANAVGPGLIRTGLEKFFPPDQLAQLEASHPIGRMGEVEEVAELVVWLASPKASFVTGAFYPVDGGSLAQ
ncbi:SDR family NAD(P)-dependent oxidoreductase [Sphingomonas sp. BGYR3]|uniref:SDR family NAD(P)-dependent oxidoreductase n=1 Tax=Sphingomonas sp. BGYR3 TaxID=2975483 RepID=UPI0021A2B7A5|nr:SDR family NAD(P)-dependent oxidoreductase [Sphingomonas sp. BGYR3]MDG5487771.1 SDR family NAD(P)-dependent oxidoreductase [Sphingomonas sp. BGYR3]